MIHSMTGFSAASTDIGDIKLSLEIRSLNHRYLDIQLRLPDELRNLETSLRSGIAALITRGKLECRVNINSRAAVASPAKLNTPLLQQLAQWSTEIHGIIPHAAALSVADVLRWNGMLENTAATAEQLQEPVLDLLQQVMLEFNATRAREGEKLQEFILQRVGQINALRAEIAPRIPHAIKAYESRLQTRLLEAMANHDEDRLRQEISLYASKIDVDEELSRLHAHLTEVERVLENGGSAGKRLDFLMQELHREANTLGSKSVDAGVSRAAMEMKILIEQMREQIQNVE